ncbi:hypothetical protein D3C80_1224110 [compost metagenome]
MLPVQLRCYIVYPLITYPCSYIGIKIIITTGSISGTACRILPVVAPDPERTDAYLHIHLLFFYRLVEHFYKFVDVISSPVINAHTGTIFRKGALIVKNFTGNFIWIKIVVYMHPIYIVSSHNVQDHLVYVVACSRIAGIEIGFSSIMNYPFRMGTGCV